MPRVNEITSTEKLLEVIRGKDDRPAAPDKQPMDLLPPGQTAGTSSVLKDNRPNGSVTVSVDIGLDSLKLVKTDRRDGKFQIIDFKRSPLPGQISRDSPEFAGYLKSALVQFCGTDRQPAIWAMMSTVDVDVRHIRIPKVPKKQIDDAVYWTLKRELPFDENESMLDFVVQNEVVDKGTPKISVMVYISPRKEVEGIKKLFSDIGVILSGISITPFAIQNLFQAGWIPKSEGPVANLFIGRDFSRIDFFVRGNLVLTRDIKAGTNSMVESLMENLHEKRGTAVGYEEARKVLYSLSSDISSNSTESGLEKDEIFEIIRPAVDRLVRQVERTFEHNAASFEREKVSNIYISSVMNAYNPMIELLARQLGLTGSILDINKTDGSMLCAGLKNASVSDRSSFVPALGLAISDNSYTPNFLITYKDRKLKATVARLNLGIFIAFISIVVALSVIYSYQGLASSRKKASISALKGELTRHTPLVNRNLFIQTADSITRKSQELKLYGKRYLGMAVINELSTLTPEGVRITGAKIELGSPVPDKIAKDATGKSLQNLIVDGIAYGDQSVAEASLSGYIMKLDGSPIFDQITVQQARFEKAKGGEGVRFTLGIKIGQVL